MNFMPVLENKRVLLRPLQKEDFPLLSPLALARPELFRYMSAFIESEADLAVFIDQALEDRKEERSIPFIVIDKEANKVAGSTRFGNIDQTHKRAEIGWTWLAEEFHHSGLNKAMKFEMLQHAFETIGLNRIEIKTNELNLRSRRAIESIGAKYEGLFRHHMINNDGSLRNTVYYSIIKEEWPELKEHVFSKYFAEW